MTPVKFPYFSLVLKYPSKRVKLGLLLLSPLLPDVSNPFYEDYSTESAAGKSNIETSILEEDWVKELMEDLDVFIAERNFEDAVDSIEKVGVWLRRVRCAKQRS